MARTLRLSWSFLVSLAGLVVAGVPCARGAEDTKYDLRGPAAKKGQIITSTESSSTKDGKATFAALGKETTVDMDISNTTEVRLEVLAMDGRQITKAKVKVVKKKTKTTIRLGGKDKEQEEDDALVGEEVLMFKAKEGWKKTLGDEAKPTEKQAKSLKNLEAPLSNDPLYPEEKVAVGHEWDVEVGKLGALMGSSIITPARKKVTKREE